MPYRRQLARIVLFRSLLLSLLFSFYACPSPVFAQEKAIQEGWAVDDENRTLLTPEVARKMRESGAKWVRLHFRLTARHRRWEDPLLTAYEQAVRNLRRERLQILGLLSYESWNGSQADWICNSREVDGGSGDNPYLRDLIENAFRPLLARFPDVQHWEIWNEPNCWTVNPPGDRDRLPGQYYIYPSNFAFLLRRAYEEARRRSDRITIISGGLLGADFTGNPEIDAAIPYLRSTVQMGREFAGWDAVKSRFGTFPVDHWGLHLYIGGGSRINADYLQKFYRAFAQSVDALEGKASRKQVWLTEIGWATPPKGLSEADQAENVTTLFAALKGQPRVGPVFWFKLYDVPAADLYYGLFRADGTPKPAWETFRKARAK
jgi:hypothetical protein